MGVGCLCAAECVPFPALLTSDSFHFRLAVITMGVHGLATYLKENVRLLSTSLVLPQKRLNSKLTPPLVVDGWSCVRQIDTRVTSSITLL